MNTMKVGIALLTWLVLSERQRAQRRFWPRDGQVLRASTDD